MKARPEPTQLEHISVDSFLGKLLVLLANVRLDRKGIARYKHSSLFCLIISNEGKQFYSIDTWLLLGKMSISRVEFNIICRKKKTKNCSFKQIKLGLAIKYHLFRELLLKGKDQYS